MVLNPFRDEKKEEKEERKEIYYINPYPTNLLDAFFKMEDLLKRIETYLRGGYVKFKPDGSIEEVIPTNAEPLLNDEGIRELMSIIRSRLDVVLNTSIIDETFIRDEVYFFNLNLIFILYKNAERWGLKKYKFIELIDFLVSAYEMALRRSLGGAFLKALFLRPTL